MVTDDSVPKLKDILDKNFSEMNIGEEHFQQPESVLTEKMKEKRKIIYQEKYSSENQTGTLVVKPIKATKEIIDSPIKIKNEEGVDSEVEVTQEKAVSIINKPSSSFGDDFDVEW